MPEESKELKSSESVQKTNVHRTHITQKRREIELAQLEKEKAAIEASTDSLTSKTKVSEMCADAGYDPMKSLINLAICGELSASEQMRLDFKLMDKMYGDVKSVEGGEDGSMAYNVTLKSFSDVKVDDLKKNLVPTSEYEGFEAEDTKVGSGQSDGAI